MNLNDSKVWRRIGRVKVLSPTSATLLSPNNSKRSATISADLPKGSLLRNFQCDLRLVRHIDGDWAGVILASDGNGRFGFSGRGNTVSAKGNDGVPNRRPMTVKPGVRFAFEVKLERQSGRGGTYGIYVNKIKLGSFPITPVQIDIFAMEAHVEVSNLQVVVH